MAQIIAHRGLRNEKPENSIEAIAAALSLPGIHGVEFDVELSADIQSVVLHQETLVPSADGQRIELASRNFASRDWVIEAHSSAITRMDAGSWMGANFKNVKVPALQDVLSLQWQSVVAYIELKDATFWGKRDPMRPGHVVEAALPHLRSFSGGMNIISFNPEILIKVRNEIAHIRTTLALWTEWRAKVQEALQEASRCGAAAISLPDIVLLEDDGWITAAHDRGLEVHAYPVSPARGEPEFLSWTAASQVDKWRRLEALGVDAILSDFARESLGYFYHKS
jgi:glycerophosphoryl diester phosphodiesterase